MIRILTLLLFVCSMVQVSAQSSANLGQDLIFNNYHLSFQAGYLQSQIQQKGNISKGNLRLFGGRGGYVGGKLTINPSKNLGLELSNNLSLQNFRYHVNLSATDFGLTEDFNLSQSIPEVYLEVPFAIIPRVAVSEKTWLFARLGMTMSWFAPLAVDFNLSSNPIMPNQGEHLGLISMRFSGDNPYFAGLFGLGFQYLTKDKNLIEISLNGNLGLSNILEGSFTIWDDEVSVGSGSFHSKGSYIGLQFAYNFTGVKKLEKEIEQLKISQ